MSVFGRKYRGVPTDTLENALRDLQKAAQMEDSFYEESSTWAYRGLQALFWLFLTQLLWLVPERSSFHAGIAALGSLGLAILIFSVIALFFILEGELFDGVFPSGFRTYLRYRRKVAPIKRELRQRGKEDQRAEVRAAENRFDEAVTEVSAKLHSTDVRGLLSLSHTDAEKGRLSLKEGP